METIVVELESLARIMTNPAMLLIVASIALAFLSGAVARSIELFQGRWFRVGRREIAAEPVARAPRVHRGS